MIKRAYKFLRKQWIRRSSDSYIDYLRKKGVKIGNGTIVKNPRNILIDITRPSLIEIGENCLLHQGLTLLTHDFTSRVFINLWNDFLPSSGKITIGNNVWFGYNCTVLKGVTIGDNCIIGIGSIVSKDIPANSVAVGAPARVVCSIEDYYNKRKKQYVEEAKKYAQSICERFNRRPCIDDFYDDYPCFVDRTNYKKYPYPYETALGSHFDKWLQNHKKIFNDFDDFLKAADIK